MTFSRLPPIAAPRARDLIVNVARWRGVRRILLPALYCGEMAEALAAAGIRHDCYDVGPDLGQDLAPVWSRLTPTTDMVVWVHWFGLYRAPPSLPRVTVLEDACHAARTVYPTRNVAPGSTENVTIFSPRKEFGWRAGGMAFLPGRRQPIGHQMLFSRWRAVPWVHLQATGRAVTKTLSDTLGDLMPTPDDGILTHLPLRSRRRDQTIATLRSQGIPAWRWRMPPRAATTSPKSYPRWAKLDREVFFVPLMSNMKPERLLPLLRDLPLRPFGDGSRSSR